MTPAVWRRIGWTLAIVVAIVIAWEIAVHIPRTLAIFVIAAFIAFGVHPITHRLERRMPKPLAIALVFVALLVAIAVGAFFIVPLTIDQTQVLIQNVPAYATQAQNWFVGVETSLAQHFPKLDLPTSGLNLGRLGSGNVAGLLGGTLSSIGSIFINAATAFFVIFSAIILSVFFLLNDGQLAAGFAALFPPARRETARNLAAEVSQLFGSYISGQVIVSAITGIAIGVISLIFGFKFWLLLGIISAIAYAIPIIGMLIAQLVAIPLCAPQGVWMVIVVQIIMFVVARISDNVLVPKIMGDAVGVSPILAMFAIFAGGELFGIPGLILGIPAAALIKILVRYFVTPWIHAQYEGTATTAKPSS